MRKYARVRVHLRDFAHDCTKQQICNRHEKVVRAGCKLLRATANQNTNIEAEVCKVARKRTSGLTVNRAFNFYII